MVRTELEGEKGQVAGSTAGPAVNISIGADNVKKFALTGIFVGAVLIALLSTMGALSLYAAWLADKANMHSELAQYYATELEGWMKEHGLHPPSDPWQPKEKKNGRP